MENLPSTVRVVTRVIQATYRSLEYPGMVANRSKTVKPAVIFVIIIITTVGSRVVLQLGSGPVVQFGGFLRIWEDFRILRGARFGAVFRAQTELGTPLEICWTDELFFLEKLRKNYFFCKTFFLHGF